MANKLRRKPPVGAVRYVEVHWDGRGYTAESWKRDRERAAKKLAGADKLFFTMPGGENVLIISTAPLDRLILDTLTEEDLDQEWLEYPSIEAFEEENQELLFEALG